MTVLWAWVRLDVRRRWKSLAVLVLLVAISGATVMASLAGARRAASAQQRLDDQVLPATVIALPNQPGFDWDRVRRLPEVAAVAPFVVDYEVQVEGIDDGGLSFPFLGNDFLHTMERPIIFSGRNLDSASAHEAIMTRQFAEHFHKRVGDTVTVDLPTEAEISASPAGGSGRLTGPRVTVRIVGIGESNWLSDLAGGEGALQVSPGLVARYPANVLGNVHDPNNPNFVNALVRLRGGDADIPQFREDLARVTGRSDIEVSSLADEQRKSQRQIAFEARCLLAFGLAAFVAALFLVGQAIARYAAAGTAELQTLRAIGLLPRQSVVAAAASPAIAGVAAALTAGVAAWVASNWMPIGGASLIEPDPGLSWDWVVLGPGIVATAVLVAAGAVATAALALGASRRAQGARRSAVAASAARLGAGVPVVVGTRFALETGRGRTAVPVRPALIGSVIGVLGILAAFTFSRGVSDAADHPERFGVTYQLTAYVGVNGQDFTTVAPLLRVLRANHDVEGVDDARTAVATGPGGNGSVSLWERDTGSKALPIVMLSGRPPQAADEVALGPTTLKALHAHVGGRVALTGSRGTTTFLITGSSLIVAGPHNDYDDGGWLTGAAYDSLFSGFKFRVVLISLVPSARTANPGPALAAQVAAADPNLRGIGFGRPDPIPQISALREVRTLPIVLGLFLVLLAIGAVGHALATAVRRRSHDLAVLRALGLTQWQCRRVVITQATVLALVGLVFGVPLGLAVGRSVWRWVADYTPLQYVPPLAVWAIAAVGPAALVIANLLAAGPGQRAARLRIAHILRTE